MLGGQKQKRFFPLGNELHFDANFAKKISFVLTTNMAAFSRGYKSGIRTPKFIQIGQSLAAVSVFEILNT